MIRRLLVLNGPNLDLLGTREPDRYGSMSLAQISADLDGVAASLGVVLEHCQSNHEGVLVERVHQAAREGVQGAIVNAGGYTHTSVALRDALLGVSLPFVEVHLTNLTAREPFRWVSVLSDVSRGVVQGFGPVGYELALRGLVAHLS